MCEVLGVKQTFNAWYDQTAIYMGYNYSLVNIHIYICYLKFLMPAYTKNVTKYQVHLQKKAKSLG